MLRRMLPLTILCVGLVQAAVTRVEVASRADVPNVPGYERVSGKVFFAVDPKLPANRAIADIDLAPRNAQGLVEFSADMLVLRPKDASKSNGTALLEISNRGSTSLVAALNLNDQFLLERGFTVAWIGWEFDVPDRAGVIKLYAPHAMGVTGPVRAEIIVQKKSTSENLGDRTMIPYPVADPSTAVMTVRDSPDGPRTTIPRAQWRLSADGHRAEYDSGFEPGRIYEVVYTSKDPEVAGLGMASVRDFAAYLKHRPAGQEGSDIKRVMTVGNSQSGRFLRTFLYEGFNADEQGKQVFEGVWAHIAGGGMGGFNTRFAQPSRSSGEYTAFDYPNKLPPFTTEELLAKSRAAGVAPKLFLTNGSQEYWGGGEALIHTTPDGKRDAPIPADARIYYVAGTSHGTSNADFTGTAQITSGNSMEWKFFQRAMVVAMNDWITRGVEPPPSQVPSISKGELVEVAALKFPKLLGVNTPKYAFHAPRLDFGPDFASKGIPAFEPPKLGAPFPALVPRVDDDGNETSGIRMAELRVPLATYTGWNLRDPKTGAPEHLVPLTGGKILFPKTRADREKSGDPRRSIEERYRDQQDYLSRTEAIARELARQRFVLESDVPLVVTLARQHFKAWTGTPQAQ
ncbi:MAG TPA: alpha/beta hydrolase domain-containing protein [Bryobacteraceae bacterium]|nr:alpha/beta hydrolase domain-containing protein [Bryobacteraceae bacterium]